MPSNVDWRRVPGDIFLQLRAGIAKAIADGLVSHSPVVNPLATIADQLGITGLPGQTKNTVPPTQKSLAANHTDAAVGDPADSHRRPAARGRHQLDGTVKSAVTAPEAAGKQAKDRADTTVKKATERLGKVAQRTTVQKVAGTDK
jgi:hypothetical protein